MFCKKCGQQIIEGTKFCMKCGTPVDSFTIPVSSVIPQKQHKNTGKIIVIILVSVIMIGLLLIGGMFVLENFWGNRNIQVEEEDKDEKEDKESDTNYISNTEIMEGTEVISGTEILADTEIFADTESIADTEILADTEIFNETEDETEHETEQLHKYEIVLKDISWTEAYKEAKSASNKYLVNIDSAKEWELIQSMLEDEKYKNCIFWIGAVRKGNESDYYWIDNKGSYVGDSLNDNSNWLTGEPTFYDDDLDLEERYVDIFFYKSENRWVWNDTIDDLVGLFSSYSGKIGYIVEIEAEE